MRKWSLVVVLLIASFVGAEENEAIQTKSSAGDTATLVPIGVQNVAAVPAVPQDQQHQITQDRLIIRTEEEEAQAGSTTTTTTGGTGAGTPAVTRGSTATAESQGPQHQIIERLEPISEDKVHAKVEKVEEPLAEDSEESKGLKEKISDGTGKPLTDPTEHWVVSPMCLDCLCYFATDCDLTRRCERPESTGGLEKGMEKGDCGPFHISFPFWADANDENMDIGDAIMEERWRKCSLDLICATESIQKYFHKYPHDCNRDGKVDCIDYAAIHTLGPFGCRETKKLNFWNSRRRKEMLKCMVKREEGKYTKAMRELQEKMKRQDIGAMKMAELDSKKSSNAAEDKTAAGKVEEKVVGKVEDNKAAELVEINTDVEEEEEGDGKMIIDVR